VAGRSRSPYRIRAFNGLSWLWASCADVGESESGELDAPRSFWESTAVNAHQLYCPGCRRFRAQMRSLAAALLLLRAQREAREKLPGLFLPADVRERIKAALRRARFESAPGNQNATSGAGTIETRPDRPPARDPEPEAGKPSA
jgi:hypothetical protein